MRYYLSLWKRTFDYKGTSTRQEYRAPLLVTAILAALTVLLWLAGSFFVDDFLMYVGLVPGVLFTLHILPMMALTVRRLRDAGKNPFLAALSCLAGIGTLIVMVICLLSVSVSGYLPSTNFAACVYGPPPYDPQYNVNVDVYGPPEDFYPEDNTEAAIYGPPEMLESRYAEEAAEIASRQTAEKASAEEGTSDEN